MKYEIPTMEVIGAGSELIQAFFGPFKRSRRTCTKPRGCLQIRRRVVPGCGVASARLRLLRPSRAVIGAAIGSRASIGVLLICSPRIRMNSVVRLC